MKLHEIKMMELDLEEKLANVKDKIEGNEEEEAEPEKPTSKEGSK